MGTESTSLRLLTRQQSYKNQLTPTVITKLQHHGRLSRRGTIEGEAGSQELLGQISQSFVDSAVVQPTQTEFKIGSSQMKMVMNPDLDPVEMHFQDGDVIRCELTSHDIWVKLKISLLLQEPDCDCEEAPQQQGRIINMTMEIKVSRHRKMKHLHSQIQKILIKLLNQQRDGAKTDANEDR